MKRTKKDAAATPVTAPVTATSVENKPAPPPDTARVVGHGTTLENLERYPVTPAAHHYLRGERLEYNQELRSRMVAAAKVAIAEVGDGKSLTDNKTVTGRQLVLSEVQTIVAEFRKEHAARLEQEEKERETKRELYNPQPDEGAVELGLVDEKGSATCSVEGCGRKFKPSTWNATRYDRASGQRVVRTVRDTVEPMRFGNFRAVDDKIAAFCPDCRRIADKKARESGQELDTTTFPAKNVAAFLERRNYAIQQQEKRESGAVGAFASSQRPDRQNNRRGGRGATSDSWFRHRR